MSTQVQLAIINESIPSPVIKKLTGGIMAQLTSSISLDEELEAIRMCETYIVGSDKDGYPDRVRSVIDGPAEIDETTIKTVASVSDLAKEKHNPDQIEEFLREHTGERLFVISA